MEATLFTHSSALSINTEKAKQLFKYTLYKHIVYNTYITPHIKLENIIINNINVINNLSYFMYYISTLGPHTEYIYIINIQL